VALVSGASVLLLDGQTLTEVGRLRGHTANLNNIAFSSDGKRLASTSADGTAKVWDLSTGEATETLALGSQSAYGVGFSPDASLLYTAAGRTLKTWDLDGRRRFLPRELSADVETELGSHAQPAPSGDRIAYLEGGGRLQLLDTRDGTLRTVTTGQGEWGDLAWSPDEATVATAGDDGIVRVWDPRTGELIRRSFQLAPGHIAGLRYTPDGKAVVVATRAGDISLIDAETLEPLGTPVTLDGLVSWAFPAPDNRSAVILMSKTSVAPGVRLPAQTWAVVDLMSGQRKTGSIGLDDAAWADFSSDGERVAFTNETGELWELDVSTGKGVWPATQTSVGGGEAKVDYSDDGELLVTTAGGSVLLWDARTGEPLGSVAPTGSGGAAEFLPGLRTVLVAADDGEVFTWDTSPDAWTRFACELVGRPVNDAEWAAAFGSRRYEQSCPAGVRTPAAALSGAGQ
jgi:WD40 repeat protein